MQRIQTITKSTNPTDINIKILIALCSLLFTIICMLVIAGFAKTFIYPIIEPFYGRVRRFFRIMKKKITIFGLDRRRLRSNYLFDLSINSGFK